MEDPLSVPLPVSPDFGRDVTNNLFSATHDHDYDNDHDMTRTLVMCFDGTADQFTDKVSLVTWWASMGPFLTRRRVDGEHRIQMLSSCIPSSRNSIRNSYATIK